MRSPFAATAEENGKVLIGGEDAPSRDHQVGAHLSSEGGPMSESTSGGGVKL